MTATSLDFAAWTARWDAQQAGYLVDREARFRVLFDAIESAIDDGPMVVVDLGCGLGSLGARLVDRFAAARVVGVDVDPVLLTLGRGVYGDRDRLSFVEADLRDAGWLERLGVDRADAVTSSTALHWLDEEQVRRLYRELASLVRPGGVFLDADHGRPGGGDAELAAMASRMVELHRARAAAGGEPVETWQEWWDAIRAEPALAGALAERDRLGHAHPHGRHQLSDDDHRRLLVEAGFRAADAVWRHGDDRVLVALR